MVEPAGGDLATPAVAPFQDGAAPLLDMPDVPCAPGTRALRPRRDERIVLAAGERERQWGFAEKGAYRDELRAEHADQLRLLENETYTAPDGDVSCIRAE